MRLRALLAGAALLVVLVVPALPAVAKSYWMDSADVSVTVNPDGSLAITEVLGFQFSGQFSGAYRDIRLRPGESLSVISVGDENDDYQSGACTTLGCTSPPGSFGVESIPGYVRIVWHHASQDEIRYFILRYTMTGVAVAYDDVVDVNLQVWGDQWAVGLDRLVSRLELPGLAAAGEVRVWGHPFGVDGTTSLGDDGVSPSLDASGIPSEQWVEMRVTFPTGLLASTSGAQVRAGNGLERILAEEATFADEEAEAARALRTGLIGGGSLAAVIAIGIGGFVFVRYGREPKVDYHRQYQQEPPSELPPAEVGGLLSQGLVDEREFTATLFDLIRQGAIVASPSQVERVTWGGLRHETITDLVLDLGEKQDGFRDFEQSVLTVVRRVLEGGPRPLHEFRQGIRDDAAANAETYQTFRSRVGAALIRSGMIDDSGARMALLLGLGVLGLVVAGFFILPNVLRGRRGGETLAVLLLVGMVLGAVALIVFLFFRRVRVKRTAQGALEAARWAAFRRYLTDFSRLEEAPAISLDLWDRFLIYAIAFGVAEEVLETARLQAPPELEQQSSIYWFGNYGYSGGHTENAFAGLSSALSGAFTPPSSSGGGGGAW
ncbi:MAG TPA: DUF2207 domain-containing protein [Acidimicrobiia bacterium]